MIHSLCSKSTQYIKKVTNSTVNIKQTQPRLFFFSNEISKHYFPTNSPESKKPKRTLRIIGARCILPSSSSRRLVAVLLGAGIRAQHLELPDARGGALFSEVRGARAKKAAPREIRLDARRLYILIIFDFKLPPPRAGLKFSQFFWILEFYRLWGPEREAELAIGILILILAEVLYSCVFALERRARLWSNGFRLILTLSCR